MEKTRSREGRPIQPRMVPSWLLWAALAFLAYGVWAVLSKLIGDALSAVQSQMVSTLGMLPVIAGLALIKGPPDPGRRRRGILVAVAGGAVSCLGNIPFFMALGDDTAKATAVFPVTALYPLVTVLLAVAILREPLWRIQIVGIVLSLAGIYLLNVPGEQGLLSPWLPVALVPVVLWGVAGFLQKVSTLDVSGKTSATWFLAAYVPVGAMLLAWEPWPSDASVGTWALAAGMGFALAFGNFAATVAYASQGKASIITPLVGLYPLISIAAALLFFGEWIGWREQIGVVLALLSIVALSYERPEKKRAPTPPEVPKP